VCAGTPNAGDCDDSDLCTDDFCSVGLGCINPANSDPCNDDNDCTTGDICSYVGDDDRIPLCAGTNEPDGTSCNDGIFCNGDDTCLGGICEHSGDPCVPSTPLCIEETDECVEFECADNEDCDDENACTDDFCNLANNQCVFTPNDANTCNDNNACSENDICVSGVCLGGNSLDCDDDNVCTDDSCDAVAGCVYTNNNAPCDDNLYCTEVDTCVAGRMRWQR